VFLQYIEATDLELEMKRENAVQYHEAWQQLCSSSGVLIPGGFGVRGMEGKILAAEWARRMKKPFLGKNNHPLNLSFLYALSNGRRGTAVLISALQLQYQKT